MRRLMWFAVGFTGMCALCVYLPGSNWQLWVPAEVLILLGVCLFFSRRLDWMRRVVAVLLGAAVAGVWFLLFQRFYLLPVSAIHGQKVNTTVTATGYAESTRYGTSVDGTCLVDGKQYAIRLFLNEEMDIEPGQEITGAFTLETSLLEDDFYYPGQGVFLLGYQSDAVELILAGKGSVRQFGAWLAEKMTLLLDAYMPADVVPFARALLLGDKSALDYPTSTAFEVSGISHVVAVSGLHVTILYAFLNFLTLRRRYVTQLLAVPVLVLFAAAVGFTPSVMRACIMICLLLLSQICSREYDAPTALACAVILILLWNPYIITSVGFQLSVGCVCGILLFASPIHRWLSSIFGKPKGRGIFARIERGIITSVSVTLGAMSLSTPLVAYYFGSVSLIGIVTNLATLWVIGFVFSCLLLVCILGLFLPAAAQILGWVVAWPMRYVLKAASLLARVPMASVYTQSTYILIWLIGAYLLLGVLLIRRGRHAGRTASAIFLGLMIAVGLSWGTPLSDDVRVTVLDVGQGQCILLQSQGKAFLVDCGGDRDTIAADTAARELRSQGISRLDGIILTHTDYDHAGGAPYLLTQVDADFLMLPDGFPEELTAPLAGTTEGEVIYVGEDMSICYDETEIQVFAPIFASEKNENSLCVLFTRGNCAILITGDRSALGEAILLRQGKLPQVDLLIAGHHGAWDSTSQELLDAVQPEIVAISSGVGNRYGHPHQELLDRLKAAGCTVWRTDEMGTIIFRGECFGEESCTTE